MIYGDSFIHEMIEQGYIENASSEQVGPASLDLRLGDNFLYIASYHEDDDTKQFIRLGREPEYYSNSDGEPRISFDPIKVTLSPHDFCLATTIEKVTLPKDIAAFVQGRSSIGRAGLSVQNAGFVDPGFTGHITLELKNETDCPIILVPGYPVAQLVFMEAVGVEHPYTGKYNGQVEATGSRMHLDAINRKGDM
jgi:dCTP deaminase